MDVRFLFERPDVTPLGLAKQLGLNPSTVYRWREGAHPDGDSLGRLVQHGYLTADDFANARAEGLADEAAAAADADATDDNSPAPPDDKGATAA